MVPGAGHMVMLEEPAHVSEVLGDLVADAIVESRERERLADAGGSSRAAGAAGRSAKAS